jgi:hypothetical protein
MCDSKQDKEKTMADNRIHEASWDLVNALRETTQTISNSFVATQDLNLRFAQSIFLNGIEVIEKETGTMNSLMQELDQQRQRQQEAFEKLTYATLDISTNYFRTLFSWYQRMGDATQSLSQQGLKYAQDATRQTMETATHAVRHGAEQAQENLHQG